jgi:hypothetical protein
MYPKIGDSWFDRTTSHVFQASDFGINIACEGNQTGWYTALL